jgi:hypothetical protein
MVQDDVEVRFELAEQRFVTKESEGSVKRAPFGCREQILGASEILVDDLSERSGVSDVLCKCWSC